MKDYYTYDFVKDTILEETKNFNSSVEDMEYEYDDYIAKYSDFLKIIKNKK